MVIDSNSNLQKNTTEKSNFSKNQKKLSCNRIEVTTGNLSRYRKLSFQQLQVTTSSNLALKKKLKHEQVKSGLEKGGCDKENMVKTKGNNQEKKCMSRHHLDVVTPL